ncbi:MAG: hypothetical protein MR488_04690 [Lachnospiraceae bacterium]|nr:hypothetical protein [Lachnospiraceae bacterium]
MSKREDFRKTMANVALRKSIEALQNTRSRDMSPKDVKEFMRLAADLREQEDEIHGGLFVNELFDSGEGGDGVHE